MSSERPATPIANDTALIRKLGIETLGGRYRAIRGIGNSFGGATFLGKDVHTGKKVFMKYQISPRGEGERAKFLTERDALESIAKQPGDDVAPQVLHFEDLEVRCN